LQGQVAELETKIKDTDVEAALEGIRKRTAANMGAPQVRHFHHFCMNYCNQRLGEGMLRANVAIVSDNVQIVAIFGQILKCKRAILGVERKGEGSPKATLWPIK